VTERLTPMSDESIERLHRGSVSSPAAVARILQRVAANGSWLDGGINRRNERRRAVIQSIDSAGLDLRLDGFDRPFSTQLYLRFSEGSDDYFFAAAVEQGSDASLARIRIPSVLYRAERRNSERTPVNRSIGDPSSVQVEGHPTRPPRVAAVLDVSSGGIGIHVPKGSLDWADAYLSLRFLDGDRAGEVAHAEIRSTVDEGAPAGWVRLGLALRPVRREGMIAVERRRTILSEAPSVRARLAATSVRAALRVASNRLARTVGTPRRDHERVPLIEYLNADGEPIRAIVDSWGAFKGGPAVVIPPAWGRTKETLLPLAATIVDTFRRQGEPVSVIRFDGTHRRGESYVSPEHRAPGSEYLDFKFSRAVSDIEATIQFLRSSPDFAASSIVLVTFSLSAIEGRRAVAAHEEGAIAGWVSVVGMTDLQSALKTISGGVDYAMGLERGVRFGKHELVGVVADMDHTGTDALVSRLVFLADAERDMSAIKTPVTWIHGRHDAWMDVDRVRQLLSAGDISQRRLLEVPTGHQLRSSRQALQTFQLVAQEVGRMALGRPVPPATPDPVRLRSRQEAERARVRSAAVSLRSFWRDYLVGRRRTFGIQLLTSTSTYAGLMKRQVEMLELRDGARVADLGCGVGDFALSLSAAKQQPGNVTVHAFDFVPDAVRRAQSRINQTPDRDRLAVSFAMCDLETSSGIAIPAASESYDAVLASLLISYLVEPIALLAEARRILRPGGRLVVSSLVRDADISKIHMDGLEELRNGRAYEALGPDAAREIDVLARDFLNDASRILDLEEQGRFTFWDEGELAELIRAAGFGDIRPESSFGDPPQAIIISGQR